MKSKHSSILKGLLVIVPALLLALIIQPAVVLAGEWTVTYEVENINYSWITYSDDKSNPVVTDPREYVVDGESPTFVRSEDTPPRGLAVYADDGWEFTYWTADKEVELLDSAKTTISEGKPITQADLLLIKVTSDLTLTAHFERSTTMHTITYTVDPVGYFPAGIDTSEQVENGQPLAKVPTPEPNDSQKYVFGYWSANVEVTLDNGGTIGANEMITIAQMSHIKVTSDITFTAHFRDTVHTITYDATSEGYFENDSSPITKYANDLSYITDVPTPISSVEAYPFVGWTASVDVVLSDGTTIKKGDLITSSKMTKIIVWEDIDFTASHPTNLYATITYKTDGNGTANPTTEKVERDGQYPWADTGELLTVGMIFGSTATPSDSSKYAFDYWTTDSVIYRLDPLTHLLYDVINVPYFESLDDYYVDGNVTFTAHFKQLKGDVTYTTDGNGSVTSDFETVTFTEQTVDSQGTKAMAGTPTGATTKPKEGYVLDYWRASEDVINASDLSIIYAGNHITDEQMHGGLLITKDTEFKAYFECASTVTYKTDGHGEILSDTTEQVIRNESYFKAEDLTTTLKVGMPGKPQIAASTNYVFDYWTADQDVYNLVWSAARDTYLLEKVEADTQLTTEQLASYYVADDTTFTAHFKRTPPYTVTYTSAGNGTVSPTSEQVEEGDNPKGPTTITPDAGYEFSHWVADKDVEVANEDATQAISLTSNDNGADAQAATTTITAGQPITPEQFSRILMADDVEFEAHFKQTSVDPDPEPEPVNPDGGDDSGSDTIKPADGEGGKLTPKTGDALPGATAAVVLGAGVAVAGAALLRKRHQ